jgi:hypothetical protein
VSHLGQKLIQSSSACPCTLAFAGGTPSGKFLEASIVGGLE